MRAPRCLLPWLLVACGTRTPLREPRTDAATLDMPPSADVPPIDVSVDLPVDVPIDLPIDLPLDLADRAPPEPDASVCTPGSFTLHARPSELVFVVDRSGSLEFTWSAVSSAFAAAIPAIDSALLTGLLMYPERACEVSPTLHVEPGIGNGPRIVSMLEAVHPAGRTPTRIAVRSVSRTLRARGSGRAGYLMLVTDGVPTCPEVGDGGDRDLPATVAALAESAAAGIPVFVIGLGATDGEMGSSLDALAIAGGRPTTSADGHRYYVVQSASEGLVAALRTVQSNVTRCELAITTPANGATVRVEFRGERVPEDPSLTNGWWWADATHRAITVRGPWCTRLAQESGDLTATITCL